MAERSSQMPSDPAESEIKLPEYRFPKNTFVYWDSGSSMGTLQADITAVELPRRKGAKGPFEYKSTSLSVVDVFYNGRTVYLRYDDIFRAYTAARRKISSPKK